MKPKVFNAEYVWIKKIVENLEIKNFIYISSPSIYLRNHYIGRYKKKIEKFLIRNNKKFKSLQIWRPFNLININYKKYSDHFHNLLFKIMFVQKKTSYKFRGNKYDERGYADINEFSHVLLKNAFLNKTFIKDFGNLDSITVTEIIRIYNKYFYKKCNRIFTPIFISKKKNKNIIKNKIKSNIYAKQKSKNIINKYLMVNLYGKNKKLFNL